MNAQENDGIQQSRNRDGVDVGISCEILLLMEIIRIWRSSFLYPSPLGPNFEVILGKQMFVLNFKTLFDRIRNEHVIAFQA